MLGLDNFGPLGPEGRGEGRTVFVVHGLEKRERPTGLHPILISVPGEELFTGFDEASGDDGNSFLDYYELAIFLVLFGGFVDAATCDAVHSEWICIDE